MSNPEYVVTAKSLASYASGSGALSFVISETRNYPDGTVQQIAVGTPDFDSCVALVARKQLKGEWGIALIHGQAQAFRIVTRISGNVLAIGWARYRYETIHEGRDFLFYALDQEGGPVQNMNIIGALGYWIRNETVINALKDYELIRFTDGVKASTRNTIHINFN